MRHFRNSTATALVGLWCAAVAGAPVSVSLRYEARAALTRAQERLSRESGNPAWALGVALSAAIPGIGVSGVDLQQPDGSFRGGGLGEDATAATAVVLVLDPGLRGTESGQTAAAFLGRSIANATGADPVRDPVLLSVAVRVVGDGVAAEFRERLRMGCDDRAEAAAEAGDPASLVLCLAVREGLYGAFPGDMAAARAGIGRLPRVPRVIEAPVRYPLLAACAASGLDPFAPGRPDPGIREAILRHLLATQRASGGWAAGYASGDDDPEATVCGALALRVLCGAPALPAENGGGDEDGAR